MNKAHGEPLAFTAFAWFLTARLLGTSVPDLLIEGIGEKSPPFFLGAMRNILDDRFEGAQSFMPAGPNPMVLAALDDARGFLATRFGTSDPAGYSQASIHAAEFPTSYGGRLDVGRFAVNGGSDTINVAPAPFFARDASGKIRPLDQLTTVEMSLYRMVIGFGDDGAPVATFDFARGASEDPDSPHFADRQPDWLDAKHAPLPFRDDDIANGAEPAVTLPGSRGAPARLTLDPTFGQRLPHFFARSYSSSGSPTGPSAK
jgi:penicillin amidase